MCSKVDGYGGLEGIMLSEISQRKTDTVCCYLHAEFKKYNKVVNITKKKQTQIQRKTSVYPWGEGRAESNMG